MARRDEEEAVADASHTQPMIRVALLCSRISPVVRALAERGFACPPLALGPSGIRACCALGDCNPEVAPVTRGNSEPA